VSEVADDNGALHPHHRGNICAGVAGARDLGESQLVLVHSVRGRQLAAIGLHEMVPDGRHPQKIRHWHKISTSLTAAQMKTLAGISIVRGRGTERKTTITLPRAVLPTNLHEGTPVVGQVPTVTRLDRRARLALRFPQRFVLVFPAEPLLVKQRHQLLRLLVRCRPHAHQHRAFDFSGNGSELRAFVSYRF